MTQSFCSLVFPFVFIPFTELTAVVTQLKDVIKKITVQISTPASTWSTPTQPAGPPVSAPSSPQVLSDPDDMVNTSKCMDTVCYFSMWGKICYAFFECTHKLERKHIDQLCAGCIQLMMD